ncbi:MAG TPA: MEDS domain-containing protein [Actinomycetota bacterium]|nr:MEDS domain-containing protein [Actinomycetota bacterium]
MIEAFVSPAALRGGDHAYAVTRSEADRSWLTRAFVENAERADARALYLTEGPADDVRRLGVRRRPRHPGGLVVVEAAPVLAPGDTFKPEIYARALESAVDASLRDGFAGAHLLVEAGWSLGQIRNVDAWWELEHVLGEMALLRRGNSLLVCQFDQEAFGSDRLQRAARSHAVEVVANANGFPAAAPMRVHREEDDVLYVVGELDRGTANLLATACRGSVGTVTIDLAEATFFDAGAHRAISRIAKSCKRVRLRNAPPIVHRVVFALQSEAGLELEVENDALSLRVG